MPQRSEGSYVVRHEVPRDKIRAADLQRGERYKGRLPDKYLGTRWWAFKDLHELEGVRLRSKKGQREKDREREDPQRAEKRERELREKSGDAPSCLGEKPEMLAMVAERPGCGG
ncbi:MAG: hypothetical protein LQ340_000675 [Diploschistes diacapsis]|nr:MAG: hypothetical protein LQ340_000675 [Diploschistes diacapsis]